MNRLVGTNMPFRVSRVSPPPMKDFGYVYLDSTTGRGDVIRVSDSEAPVVVNRVRLKYEFVGGRYRLQTKILEVSTPRRFMVNERLQEMVTRTDKD